jgi:hypothetical protein
MDEQQAVILCQSTRKLVQPPVTAQRGLCSDCKTPIWLAPSSVNVLRDFPNAKTLCEVCGPKWITSSDVPVAIALAPGAIEEARAFGKKVQNN